MDEKERKFVEIIKLIDEQAFKRYVKHVVDDRMSIGKSTYALKMKDDIYKILIQKRYELTKQIWDELNE